MTDLREHFERTEPMLAPDLWAEIETRRPAPLPPRRHGLVIALALGLAVVGLSVAAVAFWPEADAGLGTSPSPAPSPSVKESPGFRDRERVRFDFVPMEIVSSSRSKLVVDAPAGLARWTFSGGSVDGRPLDGSEGSGGFGGGCPGDAYLAACGPGGLSLGGRFYSVVYGRALPVEGYRVRITLADGRTSTVVPVEGLWMVVTGPVERPYWAVPDRNSEVRTVELIAPDGQISSVENVPAGP